MQGTVDIRRSVYVIIQFPPFLVTLQSILLANDEDDDDEIDENVATSANKAALSDRSKEGRNKCYIPAQDKIPETKRLLCI